MGDDGAALGQVIAAIGIGAAALVGLGGLAVDARLPRGGEGAGIQAGELGVALNDRVGGGALVRQTDHVSIAGARVVEVVSTAGGREQQSVVVSVLRERVALGDVGDREERGDLVVRRSRVVRGGRGRGDRARGGARSARGIRVGLGARGRRGGRVRVRTRGAGGEAGRERGGPDDGDEAVAVHGIPSVTRD